MDYDELLEDLESPFNACSERHKCAEAVRKLNLLKKRAEEAPRYYPERRPRQDPRSGPRRRLPSHRLCARDGSVALLHFGAQRKATTLKGESKRKRLSAVGMTRASTPVRGF